MVAFRAHTPGETVINLTPGDEPDEYVRELDHNAASLSSISASSSASISHSKAISVIEYGVSGSSYDPRQGALQLSDCLTKTQVKGGTRSSWGDIALICAFNNQAEIESVYNQEGGGEQCRVIGEPTEGALRVLVEKIGIHLSTPPATSTTTCAATATSTTTDTMSAESPLSTANIPDLRRHSSLLEEQYERLATLEFTRERKRMSVLCRPNTPKPGTLNKRANRAKVSPNVLLVKGAAELVLERCSQVKLEDGSVVAITPEMRVQLQHTLKTLSSRPLRCVALAYTTDERSLRLVQGRFTYMSCSISCALYLYTDAYYIHTCTRTRMSYLGL